MITAAMRLTKMRSTPVMISGRLDVQSVTLSRSLHVSTMIRASRASRTQRTSSKSRAAPSSKASASAANGNSSKIQVLPFDMTPPRALHHAGAAMVQGQMRLRIGEPSSFYAKAWSLFQVFRALLRLSHKLVIPNVLRWRAIYLPVWRLDQIVTVKERISGGKIDLEAIALGSVIPATQTEPLASAPLSFQPGDSLSTGVLEAFNPQKHLRPFKPEDLLFRQEVGQAPMVVPFSSILPDVEALWRKVASKHTNETIDLSEDIKTILQTASPILMPYYLIDFEDANPSYSGDPITTCLILGRTFPNPQEIYANLCRDGTWLEGNPQFKQLALSLVVHPENDDESGETASLPLSVQKEAMTTLLGIAHEVRLEIQNEAIRVDPNTRLSEFGEKIENIESIMKYDDCAQKNKEYALARIESRLALQAHLVAQAAGDSIPDDLLKRTRTAFDEAKKKVRELGPPWLRT